MKKGLLVSLVAGAAMLLTSGIASAEVQLEGVAYIQGHGGHIVALNLATGEVGRISHGKPSDALTVSKDEKTLYAFSLDGFSKEIDLKTGDQTEWKKFGKKHCGSNYAPDGTIWVSDMKDGNVYVYNPKTHKLVDNFPVGKSICGINFSKDGKTAYVSDMPGGYVAVVDVKTKKVLSKISGVGNFIHRSAITPNGKELWQSDGSELKAGKAVGVGYASAGSTSGMVSIIDLKSGKVTDKVIIGGNPHDVIFTPDGKHAIVATRQLPEATDSALVVINTKTKRVEKIYSACKSCHGALEVDIDEEVDGGRPFLCAVDVAWGQKEIPNSVESMASLTESQ